MGSGTSTFKNENDFIALILYSSVIAKNIF